jgi:hypothetical protein
MPSIEVPLISPNARNVLPIRPFLLRICPRPGADPQDNQISKPLPLPDMAPT